MKCHPADAGTWSSKTIFAILLRHLSVPDFDFTASDEEKTELTKATERPQKESGFPEIITVSEEGGERRDGSSYHNPSF